MENSKKQRAYRIIMVVVLTAFITFVLTSILMFKYITENITSENSNYSNLNIRLKSYRKLLDQYYLGDIDDEKLEEGAIKGYIDGVGDKYTEYISKDEMKDYMSDTLGNYTGIGIYMVKNTKYDKVQVLATIKNGPAEKAGIQAGDIIVKVDGEEYSADDMTKMANHIKADAGTKIQLEILRDGKTLNFDLVTESVKINQVESKVLSNNIGYIEFSSFDESTAEDFKTEFEKLQNQKIKSLIIDLRNNGGGLVDSALKIADYMTDKGSVLLYEVDKNNNETVKKAESDPIINMPIIILTNENTASASEILAGALKDLGKAKTVGTTTYGKGVIQQIINLSDGSGLKVTIREYQTPNKTKINGIGIAPDYEVKLPDDLENQFNIDEDKDTQLQKAIELLK